MAILMMCVLLLSGCVWQDIFTVLDTFQESPPQTTNIAYASGPDNILDVYLPAQGSGPFPVVMLIHGTEVNKDYFTGTNTVQDLVAQGYAAVSIHYAEPTPTNPNSVMDDAACALAWIHNSSRTYPFDTSNVVVLGHSRGAAMAILLAVIDEPGLLLGNCEYRLPDANWVKGAVGYGGSYAVPAVSFANPNFQKTLQDSVGMTAEQIQALETVLSTVPPEEWRSSPQMPEPLRLLANFLPLAWLDGSEPPILLVHGENDERTPVIESQAFANILAAKGVPLTLVIIPGAFHRLNQDALHDALFTFLDTVTGR